MSFINPVLRLDADAMVKYISAIQKTNFKPAPAGTSYAGRMWAPEGVVWHNTGSPSLGLWNTWSPTTRINYGAGLDPYYKNMGWHSGPHFMGTPDGWSWILCDVNSDGVHDSCRNENYYGVETIGNFTTGGDDPSNGQGLASMQASANIIAALCVRFGWNPETAVAFHRDCIADHHACPGNLVTNAWALGLVTARIAEIKGAPQ
jgi:hypothetical protein